MDGDVIAHLINGLEIHNLDGGIQHQRVLHGQIGVVAIDVHAQLYGGICHLYTDRTQTDDAQVLAHDLGADELALALLYQLFHIAVRLGESGNPLNAADYVTGSQHQCADYQLLDGVGVGAGGVEHHDTGFGALVQRNVVGTGTGAGNGAEVGAECHLVHVGGTNQNAVGVFAGIGDGEFFLI